MRLDPFFIVECDWCEEKTEYEMTALSNNCWDMRGAESQVEKDWLIVDGKHFCDAACQAGFEG
jgi:hypothetical protein